MNQTDKQTSVSPQLQECFTKTKGLARMCLGALAGFLLAGASGTVSAADNEPNNQFGQGGGLFENQLGTGTAAGDSVTAQDWFLLWSPGGGNDVIVIDLFHTHSEGDLDLELYNPNNVLVATSSSATNNESITVPALIRGYYWYRIYPFPSGSATGTNQTYQHRWEVSDDNFEPNDSSGTGPVLPPNTLLSTVPAPGSNSTYTSIGQAFDDDWFTINVPSGRLNLSIYCLFSHATSDIELELWNSTGTSRLASATSSTDNETIQFTVPSSGTYQIRTRTAGTANGNTYDLLWLAKTAPDNYEPNDLRQFSFVLPVNTSLGNLLGLASSDTDDDFYKITTSAGQPNLTINLNGVNNNTDLDVQLLNSAGDVVASSAAGGSIEEIAFVAPTPGDYFIRVFTFSGPPISYNLTWTATSGPTTSISPLTNNLPAIGGSYGITVTSNTNWSVAGLPAWATANPMSGSNNGVVNVTVNPNAAVTSRSQAITIGGNTHTINQAAAGATTTISPPNRNSPSFGDSYSITVTSNTDWNVTGVPLWASANPSSGNGNGTVTITVTLNPSITARNQALSIGGQSHLISQEAALPTTTISPSTKNIPFSGEAYSINVTSNAPWTVAGVPVWMQVTPSSGSGNGSVTVTASSNLGTASRNVTLSINGNQHSVVQAGNPKDLALIARLTNLVNKQSKKIKKASKKGKQKKVAKLSKKLNKLQSQLRAAQSA